MADIFKEVDEELRRDHADRLWKKYGKYVIAVALGAVLATAGFEAWKWWDTAQRTERSERYAVAVQLLERGDSEAAAAAFGEISGTDGGYGTLAAFNEANLLAAAGDAAAAIEVWDRLAASKAADPAFRGAATLLAVLHQLDDGDPAVLQGRLQPLTLAGSGFRSMALELTAVLALRQGERTRARELYAQIADDRAAPVGLRARASQMLDALED